MTTTLQPLQYNQREKNLDILRGFALAGVLFVYCVSDMGASGDHVNSFWDDLIAWPKWVLIENRMYNMLILIFGMGFSVQVSKARQKQESIVPVFLRRLTGLLIIGIIHAIVLSSRDILIFYAIAGFALLPARNLTTRGLMIFMSIVFLLLVTKTLDRLFNTQTGHQNLAEPNSFIEHIQYNWRDFKIYHRTLGIYVDMLFHFLLGFYLYRTGFLEKIKTDKRFRKKLLLISLVCFLVLGPPMYLWMESVGWSYINKLENSFQKFLLRTCASIYWQLWMFCCVLLYIAILISLSAIGKFKNMFRPLAAFGQMALSNYLIQSIILVPYALLFNKFGNTPHAEGFIVFLVMFALQSWFSIWWLKKFRMGPFEWLLRSFTYWQRQPMKKKEKI
jgi:uncharacterized protein